MKQSSSKSKEWDKTRAHKKKELSRKAKESQDLHEMQRKEMERIHTQKVKIILHKALLLPPGQFNSFIVKLNIPLRKDEIDERMAVAFPELEWRKPDGAD